MAILQWLAAVDHFHPVQAVDCSARALWSKSPIPIGGSKPILVRIESVFNGYVLAALVAIVSLMAHRNKPVPPTPEAYPALRARNRHTTLASRQREVGKPEACCYGALN